MATYYVATTGNDTTGDGSEGNPWASPGKAAGSITTGDIVRVLAGTYSIGTGTVNTAGNRISISGTFWLADDPDNPPVLQATANSQTLVSFSGTLSLSRCQWITASGTGFTSVTGFTGGAAYLFGCKAVGCNNGFVAGGDAWRAVGCWADSCAQGIRTGSGNRSHSAHACVATNCTSIGFAISPGVATDCIAAGCFDGFDCSQHHSLLLRCVAYGSGSDGFSIASYLTNIISCVAVGSTVYGFNVSSSAVASLLNCAGQGNTSGDTTGTLFSNDGFVTLSADPFTDAASLDFSLNNAAGGGALLKGAGYPASFPGLLGSSYPDIGAYQSDGSGGASGPTYFLF